MTQFSIKPFDELTNVDIYHILKARSQVFVVEQHCAYQDMDEVDFDCLHLVAHKEGVLIGYCRIIPPEFNNLTPKTAEYHNSKPMPSIGRVLVMPEHRRSGLARQMMSQAIKYCRKKFGKRPIIISAQTYLIQFYESLGFVANGERYLEDGIEHDTMILNPSKKLKIKSTGSELSIMNKLLYGLLLILASLFLIGVIYLAI